MRLQAHFSVRARDVDLSFEVAPGETVALLGPNGAGKSTTLDVLAGLVKPDTGRIVLGEEVLHDVDVHRAPHARRTGLLAQDPLLFPHLCALDNVAFGLRARGRSRREAADEARAWLARVDAAALAGHRPRMLSGGQAQRVAIARALAADPRLVLLDEPLAALDAQSAPAVRQLLRQVLTGRTAVLVTHHVMDAALLADRVVVLEHGRIVEQGPTRTVLARPRSAFLARFVGLNLVDGHTGDDQALRCPDGRLLHGLWAEDRPPGSDAPALAAFRPSAVAVHATPPGGSPRNAWTVEVSSVEPLGDLVRVRAGDLAADLTPAAAAELDLAPGRSVTFAVKAAEVALYPR